MTIAPNKASSESNSNNLKKDDFPKTAPAAYPVFFRSYSRKTSSGKRENWSEVGKRNLSGLKELGELSDEEMTCSFSTINSGSGILSIFFLIQKFHIKHNFTQSVK